MPPDRPPLSDAVALPAGMPLYVDMDGSLLRGDTLHESVLLLLRQNPLNLLRLLAWLWLGKAGFKRRVAQAVCPEPDALPVNPAFHDWLRREHAAGRELVLATAADARVAQAVAGAHPLFADVLASNDGDATGNLSRGRKLTAIRAHALARGHATFAYAGNASDDLPVWAGSAAAVVVAAPAGVRRALATMHPQALEFDRRGWRAATVLRAMRVHQWAKNLLLFVPLLAAHSLNPDAWRAALLGFVAFGLCASATYLINDLLDLPNDRRHVHKRHRALAAGDMSVRQAVVVSALSLLGGLGLAGTLGDDLLRWLVLYTVITLSYSLWLKRVMLLDVAVLSGFYALRMLAGADVAGVALSNWLLAFSLFLFLSLALVKRCAELEELVASGAAERSAGRGYRTADLSMLRMMGLSSGFLAVLVMALYIDSQNGRTLYTEPDWLWGVPPLLLVWVMRVWLMAGRRELEGEDPVLFALRDRFSWLVVLAVAGLAVLAT